MKASKKGLIVFCALAFSFLCTAQRVDYSGEFISNASSLFEYCETCTQYENFSDTVKNEVFRKVKENVPNLGATNDNHWFRVTINTQSHKDLDLQIPYPTINYLDVYFFENDELVKCANTGNLRPFGNKEVKHQDFIFRLPNSQNDIQVFFRVKNNSQLMFPVNLGKATDIEERLLLKEHFLGLYGGIILVMLLYNLFIYIATRDHTYLWYLLYLIAVGATQLTLTGILEKYILSNSEFFSTYSVHLAGILSGLSVVVFAYFFLNVKKYAKWLETSFKVILGVYTITILLLVLGYHMLSYNLINLTASVGVVVLLIGSISIAKKGYRPARYFIVAWSFFMASIIVFVLKDFGILPYNPYTVYAVPFGSAIEVMLLSFALADKINVLTAEKDASRIRELEALKENEQLVREQNVILESKVTERTKELSKANLELESVLYNLKSAQTQLVSQEKMASLGQLTAGIAHEINNPINFVSSNINPLRRDIKDLLEVIEKYRSIVSVDEFEAKRKEVEAFLDEIDFGYVIKEIDQLVNGIQEGADRTAEIVKGLKNFSRLDEVESKSANLHEGIDSTLLIILSGSKVKVEIVKDYDENIIEIECFPGKLNQVFSNILSNGFQAMENNLPENPPSMKITTKQMKEHISLSFKDNGPGIPAKTIEKIYEPFFTTKEVGEGTGLGLSIVFSIIESHKGKIEVNSEPPNGTEFLITLPKSMA